MFTKFYKNRLALILFCTILACCFLFKFDAADAKCYHQRNPMGYVNYDICEVEGTNYSCVSLENNSKTNFGGISCFLTEKSSQDNDDQQSQKESNNNDKKNRFIERGI